VDINRGVIVVGGGASGMAAAIAAARMGAPVTVLERMARVGKKLLATGNGRCNLANARLELGRFHGGDLQAVRAALEAFGLDSTLGFFAELGIAAREEEAGKIFPRSGQASAVLDVLRHELSRLGVVTHCDSPVSSLERCGGLWRARTSGGVHEGAAIVLGAGGRAAPQLGSNGSGHLLAAALGHRIVDPFPALTRLRVRSPWLGHLKGLKVDGTVELAGSAAAGEILFTENGLSGPPVLDVSRRAGEGLRRGEAIEVRLDLCPDLPGAALIAMLRERFLGGRDVTAEFALVGFLHKRLIVPVLRESGIDPVARAGAVREPAVKVLAALLHGWRLPVVGTDSWTEAQVTAGGVDLAGVHPSTLESRIAPGLFFAGEVLDVDGDCGGFNLQWAWSSGRLAGTGAATRALAHTERAR
jgi:hypothetical protein